MQEVAVQGSAVVCYRLCSAVAVYVRIVLHCDERQHIALCVQSCAFRAGALQIRT